MSFLNAPSAGPFGGVAEVTPDYAYSWLRTFAPIPTSFTIWRLAARSLMLKRVAPFLNQLLSGPGKPA